MKCVEQKKKKRNKRQTQIYELKWWQNESKARFNSRGLSFKNLNTCFSVRIFSKSWRFPRSFFVSVLLLLSFLFFHLIPLAFCFFLQSFSFPFCVLDPTFLPLLFLPEYLRWLSEPLVFRLFALSLCFLNPASHFHFVSVHFLRWIQFHKLKISRDYTFSHSFDFTQQLDSK